MNSETAHSISKRGRVGEGEPTKRTPEVVAKIKKKKQGDSIRKQVFFLQSAPRYDDQGVA